MFAVSKLPGLPLLLIPAVLILAGCSLLRQDNPVDDTNGPDITPTRMDYVDTDAFDVLLETALVNQDPVILIRTGHAQPDWSGRLNAWIAAWNRSERAHRKRPGLRAEGEPENEPKIRGQIPDLSHLPFDAQSIRELRLLVSGLLDRIEDRAQAGASWWQEERARSRRVSLLRPYNLRFHQDDAKNIQLILFHGQYSSYYPRFMQLLMNGEMKPEDSSWTRSLECSCSRCDPHPFRTVNDRRERLE